MTNEELLEAYADGYWDKTPIVSQSDGDQHLAGLREVEKRARVVPEVGRRDAMLEAAAYCQDLSEMSYRAGNLLLGAAQDSMARELERRATSQPQEER